MVFARAIRKRTAELQMVVELALGVHQQLLWQAPNGLFARRSVEENERGRAPARTPCVGPFAGRKNNRVCQRCARSRSL
jgi:hypothetical protein